MIGGRGQNWSIGRASHGLEVFSENAPSRRSGASHWCRAVAHEYAWLAVAEVRPNGTAGRLGSLPVAFGAEFDIQGAQVLPPEIVQRRELVLAARIV
jgi:hypothetical protein